MDITDGPPPHDHRPADILRTLSAPTQRGLLRFLVMPLVTGLLLAAHPWSYVPSGGRHPDRAGRQSTPAAVVPAPGSPGAAAPTGQDTGGTAGTGADPAATDPASQAAGVDAVLERSAGHRTAVRDAVTDATACGAGVSTGTDTASFRDAAGTRSALSVEVAGLPLDQLPERADVVRLLRAALDLSATVDTDFAAWAEALRDGDCDPDTTTGHPDYHAAETDSASATRAKDAFLAIWNPVAERYGLRSWQAIQF